MITVSHDTETALITDLVKAPALTCVSWAQDSESGLFKWDDNDARDRVASWYEGCIGVGANIAYDSAVYMAEWPELTPIIFQAYEEDRVGCVQVSAKLIDNADGCMGRHPVFVMVKTADGKAVKSNYSLAALTKRFLGEELEKDQYRMGYGALREVPLEDWEEGARIYPVKDATSTLGVWNAEQLGYPELLADQFRQARHAFWLHLVGLHGVRVDLERVAHLEKRLLADKEERVARLVAAGLIHPKKKKNQKTKQYEWARNTKNAKARMMSVCQSLGRPWVETDGGDVCLDKDAVGDLGDDLLDDYAAVTSLTKRLGTEIRALKRGEIHARSDSFKANGRTGTSDPMNTQNLPRAGGERECFIPRPGFVFADADYDMLELRTWAQVCLETLGQSTLANDLTSDPPVDVHLAMGGEILGGVSYEEMKARKKETKVKEARQSAKPVNFMLPGGGGAERLVDAAKKDYGITFPNDPEKDWVEKKGRVDGEWVVLARYKKPGVAYARALIEAWKRKRPEAQPYLTMVSQMVRDAGGKAVLKALFVDRYHGGLGYCDLANYHFSALANDIAKDAGWRVSRECWDWTQGSVLYGSRIVLFPHDQIIAEVPIPIAHECAQRIGHLMIGREWTKRWLPDVPPTCTPCLATCFSKMAEAYYDEAGRLIPWSLEGEVAKTLAEFLGRVTLLWEKEKRT